MPRLSAENLTIYCGCEKVNFLEAYVTAGMGSLTTACMEGQLCMCLDVQSEYLLNICRAYSCTLTNLN